MPTIMVAEDDVTMVSLLKTLLGMEGYQVLTPDINESIFSFFVGRFGKLGQSFLVELSLLLNTILHQGSVLCEGCLTILKRDRNSPSNPPIVAVAKGFKNFQGLLLQWGFKDLTKG